VNGTTTARVTPLHDPATAKPLLPPVNTEAEQALLGAILVNNAAYHRVSEFLDAGHFGNGLHGRIFAAIGKLIEHSQIADPITLKNLFEQDGTLQEIGGVQYLARLGEAAVTIINAEHYGRTIHDLHLRRELITIGQDVVTDAFKNDLDDAAPEQIERAEQKLFALADSGRADGGGLRPLDLGETIRLAEQARKGNVSGLATGFIELDGKLGGFQSGNLVILAARTSMGKTALATNIAVNVSRSGRSVAHFSLEMSREQMHLRILAERSGIPAELIRRGKLQQSDFDRLIEIEREMSATPLLIDDTASLSIAALRGRARRLKRQQGLGLIVVDYLQLMRPAAAARSAENRVNEVSEISRGLKMIARELDVPLLALSQLSREVERRPDKRPMLADLRESGSIEQDADIVLFIYREEYYLSRQDPAKLSAEEEQTLADVQNTAEIIIGKNRSGAIGTAVLFFDATLTRFDNLRRNAPEAGTPVDRGKYRSAYRDASDDLSR
jgi:replicative DNA helicase